MKVFKFNFTSSIFTYILFIGLSVVPLVVFKDYQTIALLIAQSIICIYFISRLKTKLSLLILLFPLITFILSEGYKEPFSDIGDGPAYTELSYNFQEAHLDNKIDFIDQLKNDIISLIFYGHFIGAFPVRLGADIFFGQKVEEKTYYLFQQYWFLILISFLFLLTIKWEIFSFSTLQIIFLFILVSPTFFDLGNAITRHYLTFFSVFLFYISFIGLIKKIHYSKFIFLGLSLILIFLGKLGYIPFLLISSLIIIWPKLKPTKKIYFSLSALTVFLVSWPLIIELNNKYQELYLVGGNTISSNGLLAIPIKIMMSILGAFPWYNPSIHYYVYGGNYLFFYFHIISALFGLWIFLRLVLYFKKILKINDELKNLILFGTIMSVTILFGSAGFHGYLSIFFPFFAPLILVKRYNINLFIPILISILLNIVLFFLR
jgi:hypothetical protein